MSLDLESTGRRPLARGPPPWRFETPKEERLMDASAGALPAMRSPDRWLAGLRIAAGVWFAKAIFTKLSVTPACGFLPVPTASDRCRQVKPILAPKHAEGN